MSYLTQWSFDPFVIAVVVVVALHERGLANLARRSRPARARQRRRRSWFFYGGLAMLLLAVASPIDYWADRYFFVHMVEHIMIMFFAPILVVAGAPWLPMVHSLPVDWRRRAGRSVLLGNWARPLRATGRFLSGGMVAVVVFNIVMVFWHLPGPFDLGESTLAVHIWLMHASFFVSGVFFWLQIIPSHPIRPKLTTMGKMGAILATNVVMFILAMALSILSTHNWYSTYASLPGVTLTPFVDQQIGAGILWVCGDFWALPAMIWVVRRAIEEEGSAGAVFDRLVHRVPVPTLERVPARWHAPGFSNAPTNGRKTNGGKWRGADALVSQSSADRSARDGRHPRDVDLRQADAPPSRSGNGQRPSPRSGNGASPASRNGASPRPGNGADPGPEPAQRSRS